MNKARRTVTVMVMATMFGALVGVGGTLHRNSNLEPAGKDCPVKKDAQDRVVEPVTSRPRPNPGVPNLSPRLAQIATGFDQPTSVGASPDGAGLWVTERSGKIIQLSTTGSNRKVALDLTERVNSDGGEQGLLSFTVIDTRSVAVFFTGGDDDVHIQLLSLDDSGLRRSMELLHVDKPGKTHNGGTVARGPDGLLYVGIGDGGGKNDSDDDAQNCENLLGTIVAIDPKVARNANRPGDAGVEIRAWGLRNPFRFSIDVEGDAFYVGDVGQRRIEEIDAIDFDDLHGINFGWDVFEGTSRFERSQLALGVVVYPVSTMKHPTACSVTGGVVYRGKKLPNLVGTYLYADLCQDRLRGFRLLDGRPLDNLDAAGAPQIVGFGTDRHDEVFAVSLGGELFAVSSAPRPAAQDA